MRLRNRVLIAAAMALVPLTAALADPQLAPFMPLNLPSSGSCACVWRGNFTTAGGAGFQLPLSGVSPNAQVVQYTFTNLGAVPVYVAAGPSQSSVATVVLPTAGTNTIGSAGNARAILPSNQVVYTFPVGSSPWWFNVVADSGTQLVEFQVGTGH